VELARVQRDLNRFITNIGSTEVRQESWNKLADLPGGKYRDLFILVAVTADTVHGG
jgi:hypothetical protein